MAASHPQRAERPLAIGPLLGGCTVGLSISWNIANTGSVATLLAHHYSTGLTVIGLLTAVMFFAELAVMLPGGRAIDRYGAKRVGSAAVLLSLVGNLLLLTTSSALLALALRAFVGLGVGLGFLAGAIYVQVGSRRNAALAGGIYGGVSLSGGGLALAIVPQLVGGFGWRAPYVSGAAVAALALVLLAACPPTTGHGGADETPRLGTLVRDPTLARLGAVSAVSFGFSVILGNWVVTLLERTGGYRQDAAGAIGSLILLLGIVGRPAGGLLVRSLPSVAWRAVAISFIVGSLCTTLLALSLGTTVDTFAAALIGLAAGIPFGATVAGASRSYPKAPGAGVGAMNTYPVLTIVLGAPLLGLTFAMPGDGRIGFAVLAALWVATIAVIPRRVRLD
jgi:predicted MFS family arabinose efflux permease